MNQLNAFISNLQQWNVDTELFNRTNVLIIYWVHCTYRWWCSWGSCVSLKWTLHFTFEMENNVLSLKWIKFRRKTVQLLDSIGISIITYIIIWIPLSTLFLSRNDIRQSKMNRSFFCSFSHSQFHSNRCNTQRLKRISFVSASEIDLNGVQSISSFVTF